MTYTTNCVRRYNKIASWRRCTLLLAILSAAVYFIVNWTGVLLQPNTVYYTERALSGMFGGRRQVQSCYRLHIALRTRFTKPRKKFFSEFQPIDVDGTLSYVYSAYMDDRRWSSDDVVSDSRPVVRLFALVNRQRHLQSNVAFTRWRCLLWNDDFALIGQTPVISCSDLNLYEMFSTAVAPTMLTCRLQDDSKVGNLSTPKYISLVTTSDCHEPRNLLPVVDLPALRQATSGGNGSKRIDFAICPKPLYRGDAMKTIYELVEFIEVNRMFGAQLFNIYVESSALVRKQLVRHCIEQYERLGVVEMIPWSLPADMQAHVPWNGQFLTATECLYRLMYRSKFVIHQDFDEFIVPTNATNWHAMLDLVNEKEAGKMKQRDVRIASYSFRNRFFPMDWPAAVNSRDATIQRQLDEIGYRHKRFRTLTQVLGESRLFQWRNRSKVIVRPENILLADVHEVSENHLIPFRKGLVNSYVNENYGILHHYRLPLHFPWTEAINASRLTDFTAEITPRLQRGLRMCKSGYVQ